MHNKVHKGLVGTLAVTASYKFLLYEFVAKKDIKLKAFKTF